MDTASPSEQSAQTIFENEGMAKAAVMGVYSYLGDTYVYGQKMSVNWQGNSDTDMSNGFMENPSSDKNGDSGPANFWADWYNKTTQWGNIFKLTELASTAVDGIRNSKLYEEGSITMKYLLGEALTLRSLAYLDWYVVGEMFLLKMVLPILTCQMYIWEKLIEIVFIRFL